MTGAKRLSEIARRIVKPEGITSTAWPSVRATCATLTISFDQWQDGAGRLILAKRKDGLYAADIVVISIPRQVGKTFLIGWIIFALCIIHPRLTVIWTAHRFKLARETFDQMRAMALLPSMLPHVDPKKGITTAAGNEAIRFRNRSRILFGARESGFGLGFTKVGVLVLDEAQRLTQVTMDDLVPTTNAATNPLIILTGTPPRPTDQGEVFTELRRAAMAGESDEVLYIELSADPDASIDDLEQLMKANPSVPHRTSMRAVNRMKKALGWESYRREGLGIWDDDVAGGDFFTPGKWTSGHKPESRIVGDIALGVAVSVDRKRAVIGAAGRNEAGSVHFEPVWFGSPAACPAEAKRLAEKHSAVAVAIAGAGPGADLVPSLELVVPASVLRVMKTDDEKTAAGEVYDLVEGVGHAHLDDADLNGAVRAAVRKDVGDRFVIGRRKSSADVSAFEAVAYAAWALGRHKTYNVLDSVL